MHFPSKSSLANRFRWTALSLAFLLFSLPANAQKAPVYCLAQKVLQDGSILFFDSSHEDATFWNVDADRPYHDDPMLTESAGLDGYVLLTNAAVIVSYRGLSKSRIDSWLDRRGFVHSIAVLNRQLAYNQWLNRLRLSSSMIIHVPPADDPAAPSAHLLAEIPVTGIRDLPTLWAEYYRMRYQLEQAEKNLLKLCRDAAGASAPCDGPPWPDGAIQLAADTLEPARAALAVYASEIRTIPLSAAVPYSGRCDDVKKKWLVYDPETAWRSYRSTADNFYRNHLERIPKDYGISFSRASRSEPEDHVVQAADLNVLDSDKAMRVRQLELAAKRRVDEAVLFLGELD